MISGINSVDGKQLLLLMQLQEYSGEVDAYVRGRGRRMIKIGKTCIIHPITWYFGYDFKYVKWLYNKTSTMILQPAW